MFFRLHQFRRCRLKRRSQSLMVNKLNHFLLGCATNQDMAGGVYCNTRNVFDWSDSTASFVNYAYDLFKMANASYLTQQRNRKLTLAHQWTVRHEPLATIPVEPSSYAQQRKFELALSRNGTSTNCRGSAMKNRKCSSFCNSFVCLRFPPTDGGPANFAPTVDDPSPTVNPFTSSRANPHGLASRCADLRRVVAAHVAIYRQLICETLSEEGDVR
uniref:Uncharacterized protein n=1 Tax=Globodera rostochiensis TaxID=31243 RepID=A0A914GX08_GLORO